MARLPGVSNNPVLTQAPRSSLSAADIANPYMAVADAFGVTGTFLQQREVSKADDQGANAVYRDDQGNLKVDLRSDFSKSGDAYNRAAMQAYTARLAGDIRTKGTTLANEAQGDVDLFGTSWKGFADTLIQGVPESARGAVTTMLETEGARLGLGVSEQKRARDIKTFEGDIKAEIQALDNEMAALARAGGTASRDYRDKQSQLHSLYGELAANPEFVVGEKEAQIELKRTESRHSTEAVLGHIDRTLATGGVAAARKEADRILTDTTLTLTPAERRQYNGLANEAIRTWGAQKKAELEPVKDKAKKLKSLLDEGIGIDSSDIDETARLLAAGGDMGGALELYSARTRARQLVAFRGSDNAAQTAALKRGAAAASSIRTKPSRPASVAPELSGRMQQAMDHYIKRGLSPIVAGGIVGNLVQESSLRTGAVNPGDGRDGTDSIGLGQWNSDRARALTAFAKARGMPVEDFETQLDFVLHELENGERSVGQALKNARTVEEATAIMIGYERPQGWSPGNPRGGHGWGNRLNMAQRAAELVGVSGSDLGVTEPFVDVDPAVIKEMRQEVTSDAKDLWTDMKAGMEKNLPPSPDEVNLLSRQLALIDDEDFRSEVARYFEAEAGASVIADLPADQVAAIVSGLKNDAADGATIAQQDLLSSMERGAKQRAEALRTDPVGYAIDRRMVDPIPPFDVSGDPGAFSGALGARQRAVDLLRARGDVGNVSALRPEDEAMLNRFIQTATPAEQARVIGSMASNLKPDTFLATMSGLSQKADTRSMAIAGALYRDNPEVAEGILRGRQLLRENSKLAPRDDEDNRADIDAILPPTVFAPAMEGPRQQLLEAATARYADLSHLAGDTSGDLNDTRMTQAINEVTGGMLDMNGSSIIAPRYGMSQDEFDTALGGLTDAELANAVTSEGISISARDLRTYGRLKSIGEGEYLVEFGPEGTATYAMSKPVQADSRTSFVGGGPFILNLGDR